MTDRQWTLYVRAWRAIGREFYVWGEVRLGPEWDGKRGSLVRGDWW